MKRLAALILAVLLAVCTLSLTASAERQDCEYAENWQGAKVAEVTDRHGITYLVMNEPGTAYYDFHINPDERYFYLVVRAGNYQGRGGCSFRLDCLDESGNTVNTFGSTVIAGDGSFYRTETWDAYAWTAMQCGETARARTKLREVQSKASERTDLLQTRLRLAAFDDDA